MSKVKKLSIAFLSLAIVLGLTFNSHLKIDWGKMEAFADDDFTRAPAYEYDFSGRSTLDEAATRGESDSDDWWLRSGGRLVHRNGEGRTLQGSLDSNDKLRVQYAKTAPVASDNGFHPQNIFRLLGQEKWKDFDQALYFEIRNANIFNPENSHDWNALSLLARYQDENNYYYAGLRMDGTVVITKKRNGQYFTLAKAPIFPGSYDKNIRPNLLPENEKLGLMMRTYTNPDNSVGVEAYVDKNGKGDWELAARAVDSGRSGGSPILLEGYAGIYSDYMDVEFADYKVWTIVENASSASGGDPVVPVSELPDISDDSDDSSNEEDRQEEQEEQPESQPDDSKDSDEASEDNDREEDEEEENTSQQEPDETPSSPSLSLYGLSSNATISETGSITEQGNSEWWVNSGGYFTVSNGVGKTVQGKLSSNDKWRLAYANANPLDTEEGFQPQNIFRLITKSTFKDFVQQGYFKMNKYNESASPNREGHNGILFFNRYKDGNNLYYTGIRVDGNAVIKKKVGGTYYTLKMNPVYSGSYNRNSNPNLIPTGKWFGLRSEVKDLSDGSVSIKVYMDTAGNGSWKLVAEAIDNGSQGAKVSGKYSVGIRTDFADVEVKEYSIKEL